MTGTAFEGSTRSLEQWILGWVLDIRYGDSKSNKSSMLLYPAIWLAFFTLYKLAL